MMSTPVFSNRLHVFIVKLARYCLYTDRIVGRAAFYAVRRDVDPARLS